MIKMVGKRKNERGYILPLSLIIMLFGTLVVGSLFTYVGAHVNTRAIARDNLNAYYAADAGIQLVIAKLIQADYDKNPDPDIVELAPLPKRYDFDEDGEMDIGEYYPPSDTDLFPELPSNDINGYEVRMTVKYIDMSMAEEYVKYEITAYAFEAGATHFGEAKDTITAVVRQEPYPRAGAMRYTATILSWQRP